MELAIRCGHESMMRTVVVVEGMQCHGFLMRVGVSELQHMAHNGMHEAMRHLSWALVTTTLHLQDIQPSASHAQAHRANGKSIAYFSQMFGISVSCGYCACS
jgi:hypothetical protein